MINLIGAGEVNVGSIVGLAVIAVILIGLMVVNYFGKKKQQEQAMKMMSELKEGDKVVTNAGIYGEIVSMRETDMGRIAIIKTGEEKTPCYITINASVIIGIDIKKDLVLDADGNPINTGDDKLKEEILKEKASNEDEKAKEEKVAKKSTRKSTRKTTKE